MSTVIEKPWFLKEIKIKQKHITLNPKVKKLGWILLKMKLQIAWYKENNQSQLILSVKLDQYDFFLWLLYGLNLENTDDWEDFTKKSLFRADTFYWIVFMPVTAIVPFFMPTIVEYDILDIQ